MRRRRDRVGCYALFRGIADGKRSGMACKSNRGPSHTTLLSMDAPMYHHHDTLIGTSSFIDINPSLRMRHYSTLNIALHSRYYVAIPGLYHITTRTDFSASNNNDEPSCSISKAATIASEHWDTTSPKASAPEAGPQCPSPDVHPHSTGRTTHTTCHRQGPQPQ